MKMTKWMEVFLASTKGRIVSLLRGAGRTVNDLAEALALTDNAVRAQLTALERDGLVQKRGVRRGLRKPHQEYELTQEAEHLFPKPYAPVLGQVLTALKQRLRPEAIEDLLRDVGCRLVAGRPVPAEGDGLEQRVQAAATALGELGGLPHVESANGRFVLHSARCPLTAVSATHPEVCQLGQALVSQIVGLPVQARCTRGSSPQCRFEIGEAER
jgi:predicted ArsR family transcriptional regulator